jgi:hypothetical protein
MSSLVPVIRGWPACANALPPTSIAAAAPGMIKNLATITHLLIRLPIGLSHHGGLMATERNWFESA